MTLVERLRALYDSGVADCRAIVHVSLLDLRAAIARIEAADTEIAAAFRSGLAQGMEDASSVANFGEKDWIEAGEQYVRALVREQDG